MWRVRNIFWASLYKKKIRKKSYVVFSLFLFWGKSLHNTTECKEFASTDTCVSTATYMFTVTRTWNMAAKLGKGGGLWPDEQPTLWQLNTQHGVTLTYKMSRSPGVWSKNKVYQFTTTFWCWVVLILCGVLQYSKIKVLKIHTGLMFTKITGTILNHIFIVGKIKLPSDQIFLFLRTL